jgi:hypothetical protein
MGSREGRSGGDLQTHGYAAAAGYPTVRRSLQRLEDEGISDRMNGSHRIFEFFMYG